jgi:hypothetical protein
MRHRIVTAIVLALALAVVPLAAQAPAKKKSATPGNTPMAINGNATTLANCVAGRGNNVHPLGWAPRGSRIVVDLEGDDEFDGIATALVVQMGADAGDDARVQYAYSDDADGVDPRLEINLENDANVVIMVGSYSGDAGCYFLKVDVRLE